MPSKDFSTYFTREGVKLEPDDLLLSVIKEFQDIGLYLINNPDILEDLGSDTLPSFAQNLNTLIYRYNKNRLRLASQKQVVKELRDENEKLEVKYAQLADEYTELAREYESISRFCMQAEVSQKEQQTKIALLEEKCERLERNTQIANESPAQISSRTREQIQAAEKRCAYYHQQLKNSQIREDHLKETIDELTEELDYYKRISPQLIIDVDKQEEIEQIKNLQVEPLPAHVVLETTFDKGAVAVLDGDKYRIYDELAQSQFVCAHCYR